MIRADGRWQIVDGRVAGRLVTVALAACCLLASADSYADATHIKDEDDGSLTIIRMEVTPADEPVPAFQHRLVCDPNERLPGNRPQWYMRAYPEETIAWRYWREQMRQDDEAFDEMYSSGTPVSEIDWSQYEKARHAARSLIEDYIVPGSRRRNCDWGLDAESLRGPEAIEFILPEFQASRALARMASLATREAISEGRHEDAIAILAANYQLGRDVSEEPFVVCGLVGLAITNIANKNLTDLIASSDSPNLYWALSEASSTPVSLAHAVRFELGIGPRLYPFLEESRDGGPRTPEQWNSVWKRWARFIDDGSYMDQNDKNYVEPRGLRFIPLLAGLAGYTHAKSRLIDWGHPREVVESMSVGEALSKYSSRSYQLIADRFYQAYLTPFSQRDLFIDRSEDYLQENRAFTDGPNREVVPIADTWLPALQAARSAEVRCARDVAALRVIEALRMHAARNNSKWPRSLDEVTCVPIPLNPATDKPFLYHRDGNTAVLELPDWEGFPGFSRRYEITIAQEK